MQTKTCTKCKTEKPISEFCKSSSNKDGLRSQCKECEAVYKKRWALNNPEKIQNAFKAFHQKNPDYRKVYNKKHFEHKIKYTNSDRHKQEKFDPKKTFSAKEWLDLCAFYDYRCVCCGKRKPLQADHVIPRTWRDSTDTIENIQPLCGECNTRKSNRHMIDYRPAAYCNLYF